jgi:simple sugar transport system permease protein
MMLHAIAGIMTPFLIAALGGLCTEKAGVLNIGMEGLMLMGAFAGAAAAGLTGSLTAGLLAAVAVSGLSSWIYATAALRLKANIFIAALALNLFAAGITQIASQAFFSTKGVVKFDHFPTMAKFSLPLLSELPLVGPLFAEHTLFVYAGWIMVPLASWFLFRTPAGLHIRAAGSNEKALELRGISPLKVRVMATTISGIACGLAGAFLSFRLGAYVPNITSGRGWIALVAIFLGYKRPGGILLVSFLFASAELCAQNAQGIGILPTSLLLAFPFFITFTGMVLFSALHTSLLKRLKKGR